MTGQILFQAMRHFYGCTSCNLLGDEVQYNNVESEFTSKSSRKMLFHLSWVSVLYVHVCIRKSTIKTTILIYLTDLSGR